MAALFSVSPPLLAQPSLGQTPTTAEKPQAPDPGAVDEGPQSQTEDKGNSAHKALFAKTDYPSAAQCKTCHPRQYRQWSVSQHAYAQISPVFLSMHNTLNHEQSNTVGEFCIRCHTPIGMDLKESLSGSNLNRSAIAREGVTCVVCHRQNKNYGKISGRMSPIKGDLTQPIYGPKGNGELRRVLNNPSQYKVVTDPNKPGRHIHREVKPFFALTTSGFCGSCHDVTFFNGIRLEEAFSEYKHSPASRKGISCQDCHMGKVQGKPSGYDFGPAAQVGDESTTPRKLTNHYFAGPDYPVVHPGIFPFNPNAKELASFSEWLAFRHERGWGTDRFEDRVSGDKGFPAPWDSADARYDGRDFINEQKKLLQWAYKERQELLENGYGLTDIRIKRASLRKGLKFQVAIKNLTEGHNVPTGFAAERLVFLQVTVRDPQGKVVYRSGHRDPNGDLRDKFSRYVHHGVLKKDKDLVNLQTKFVIRQLRGGERESILTVNRSFDPRPFPRPSTFSNILNGGPRNARELRKSLAPGGIRWGTYSLKKLNQPGVYTISVKLIAQMVPVNLIGRIEEVGFDYGLSPRTLARRIVKGAHVVATKTLKVKVEGAKP